MADDFDEDDLADHELPDPSDMDDDGEDNEDHEVDVGQPCPSCRRPVYHDAAVCPHCGEMISARSATTSRGTLLTIAMIVLVVVLVLIFLVMR